MDAFGWKANDLPEASFDKEQKAQQSDRRNGPVNLQKAKTAQSALRTAAERRKAVQACIDEVFEKTGKRITRKDIGTSAQYSTRTEFERWKRNDPKATRAANERFVQLLQEKRHLK